VIHDLGFLTYPDQVDAVTAWWYRNRFPQFARRATRLATVSAFSRDDIATRYQIPATQISVIPNAARSVFRPIPAEQQMAVRASITGGAPYFVFVGVIQPRKNLPTLLRAFDRFKQVHALPHKLVIAGRKGWKTDEVDTLLKQLPSSSDVIFTGYLSDADLAGVVASASALTMVPHFEGFGIPIIEAMACGTPVVTSTVTSLPEVTGGAAILVDPNNVDTLSDALAHIATDNTLAADLSVRGLARSHQYSWDDSAKRLWTLVEEDAISARR
jgi:glycosyltransferase involved in cell wall biosynthesis